MSHRDGIPRGGNGRFIKTREHAELQRRAVELRTAGWTYKDIAQSLGYSDSSSARKAVERALQEVISPAVEAYRALELERLEVIHRELTKVLLDPPPLISASGKVATGSDGRPVPDRTVQVAAARELRQAGESRRRMLGTDAPGKKQIEVSHIDEAAVEAEIMRLCDQLGIRYESPDQPQRPTAQWERVHSPDSARPPVALPRSEWQVDLPRDGDDGSN